MESYRGYLDHLVVEDIHFHSYVTLRKTHLLPSTLDGWVAVNVWRILIFLSASCNIYTPKDPYVYDPLSIRNMDIIFYDYLNQLVSKEAQITIVHRI